MLISTIHDVTKRVMNEKRLAEALDTLERQATELARSNEELEQFAYVASHDLRQPLRQISSYITLLDRRYSSNFDEDAREFIGFAREGAARMDHLIVDLLEYSRIGRKSYPMKPSSLATLLIEAQQNLILSLEDTKGKIETDIPVDLPPIVCDSIEITRLMQNLIGNAIKYHTLDRPPVVRVSARTVDNNVELSVSDNGIGIAAEHFDRIFGIFQRLHGSGEYEGTGIGLAVCKKIVDHHKGKIWLKSTVGVGTTFYILLPITNEE